MVAASVVLQCSDREELPGAERTREGRFAGLVRRAGPRRRMALPTVGIEVLGRAEQPAAVRASGPDFVVIDVRHPKRHSLGTLLGCGRGVVRRKVFPDTPFDASRRLIASGSGRSLGGASPAPFSPVNVAAGLRSPVGCRGLRVRGTSCTRRRGRLDDCFDVRALPRSSRGVRCLGPSPPRSLRNHSDAGHGALFRHSGGPN